MTYTLTDLRHRTPHVTARGFLAAHPGSWIQYYDDTPGEDSAKALAARRFDPDTARRKQRAGCAVAFSVQPFGQRRTADELLCVRSLGVDMDVVVGAQRLTLPPEAIDRRKDLYLALVLSRFPLAPHWIIETRHGFHLLFRVQPCREPKTVAEAQGLHRRLADALGGDPDALPLTQLLRVPGTLQFAVPGAPFLCRLLLDNAARIPPYALPTVRGAIDASDAMWKRRSTPVVAPPAPPRWRRGLDGVAAGERNITAASLVGKIVGRLPEALWETAGWGGLKEWNARNTGPLPERELRAVYESIARRERAKRTTAGPASRTSLAEGSPSTLPPTPHAER